jgi:uncharacterized protein YjbI with pentapeptide repeats
MSLAKIAVLFLRLASLGGVLFSGILIACPFLMPEEIPESAARVISPGCLSSCFLVLLLPLSSVPAMIAWVIQERNVKPKQVIEKNWREAALFREERLWVWIGYLAESGMRHRLHSDKDTMPLVLQAEIPRALRELDRGRQARLLRFIQEIGWKNAPDGTSFTPAYGILAAEPDTKLPRQGLVVVAAGTFALLSGFFLLWATLTLVTLLFANPLQALGMSGGRLGEVLIALPAILIPALLCGLASAGLRRLNRQAVRSLEEDNGDREAKQKLILASVQNQIEGLERWATAGDAESEPLAGQILRATVAVTAAELDGLYRAKLVRLLYDSDWISGAKAFSMDGFDLRGMELGGVCLPGICLSGADLSGADLSNTDLSGADLRRCALCGSDLRSARLVGANLCGADLRYSRLQKADLERTDLRSVLLEGANFWGATLADADLSDSQGSAEFLAPVVDAVERRDA